MKKKITLALIIGATTFIKAQSNLVFNQALIVELVTGEEQTVPEGKVWKVESASDGPTRSFKVNGSTWYSSFNYGGRNLPAWFPAGTILKIEGSNNSKSLSILEFNVISTSSSSEGSSSRLSSEGLVFSQVINYSGTYNFPTNYTGHIYETFEIPEGKVWKITSVTVAKMQGVNSIYDTAVRPSSAVGVQLGGIVIHLVSGGGVAYPEVHPINDTWINSGSKELFVTSYGANTKVSFTAIEYIIPE